MPDSIVSNIVLIGMMGSSKTTTGRALSEISGRIFFDTDEVFESVYGEIAETFHLGGEALFRQRESEIMLSLAKAQNSVIALGGGAVLNGPAMQDLKQTGIVVFLYTDTRKLFERLKGESAKRPLLHGIDILERIEQLSSERAALYHGFADYVVDNTELTPMQTAEEILRQIQAVNQAD